MYGVHGGRRGRKGFCGRKGAGFRRLIFQMTPNFHNVAGRCARYVVIHTSSQAGAAPWRRRHNCRALHIHISSAGTSPDVTAAGIVHWVIEAVTTFASVIVAAAIAYLAALAAWRRQQRREVYGAFVAATDDALEAVDILLAEDRNTCLRDLDQWEDFRQARHRFDAAWGQVRLVAPASLARHAHDLGFALLEFERDAKDLSVKQARELREKNLFLSWDHALAFVAAARKDLKVEAKTPGNWLRR